ncbi:Os01g0911900 [Oryza sativa Japonica Group]|uniref:Os01g0911900 protein n=1 Tax=Oryza sativa subsp. japonica TaxID=39947 RepID=C7IWT1_ORYSJ|nr:Os01g0911900 [Oryza sativa Japonica Group]|eukprot:NP_001172707.1 Os01g0911900 [Oryza sativa Japonica Group]
MEVWIEKVNGRFKILDTLHQALPSMSLIASDFSYLPDVSIPGDRAPLVSSKLDSAAFMEEFGLPLKTRTKDGYNPLLDDFRNTKFYLSVPTHNKK